MRKKAKKIIVAMSGGVDSSVAAALLKRAGFYPEDIRLSSVEALGRRVDVVGVFIKLWKSDRFSEKRARAVAANLSIPFYVFNFEKEFKKKVVDYFLKNYKLGLTPNPCVVCNKEIKFGLLLKKALSLEADYIATGHYARLRQGKLCKGKDKEKDQSYFLWQLNQRILKKILFPVGDYTKIEVKKLAKKFKLPVLDIPESQEICFIQTTIHPHTKRGQLAKGGKIGEASPRYGVRVNDFLKKHLKSKPGEIVAVPTDVGSSLASKRRDPKGKIIGKHQGLHFYTIGQRKGIPAFAKATAGKGATALPSEASSVSEKRRRAGKPFYVLDKDIKRNILIITQNEKDLYKKELIAKNVNWISGKPPKLPLKIMVKIRYRHKSASAAITKQAAGRVKVVFSNSQRAITPGQSVVFYKKGELLGGGIIL